MAGTKRIEALYGPYAGGHIDVDEDVAAQAISDGWARDPYSTEPQEEKEWTQEGYVKTLEAADKAARKIRGEDTDEADAKKEKPKAKEAKAEPKAEARDADEEKSSRPDPLKTEAYEAASSSSGYQTRSPKK